VSEEIRKEGRKKAHQQRRYGYSACGYGVLLMRSRCLDRLSVLEEVTMLEDLDACISNLDYDSQTCLDLACLIGWSIIRISQALRISPGRVVAIIRQATASVASEMMKLGWPVIKNNQLGRS